MRGKTPESQMLYDREIERSGRKNMHKAKNWTNYNNKKQTWPTPKKHRHVTNKNSPMRFRPTKPGNNHRQMEIKTRVIQLQHTNSFSIMDHEDMSYARRCLVHGDIYIQNKERRR